MNVEHLGHAGLHAALGRAGSESNHGAAKRMEFEHSGQTLALDELKQRLAEQAEVLAPRLLPAGHREGNQWVAGDISGAPGKSLKVCLSGPKAGLVKDFAGSEKGGTLIDVYMATHGCDFKAAAAGCAALVGMPWPASSSPEPKSARTAPPFAWEPCRAALTHDDLSHLSDWRGFTYATCERLRDLGILGAYRDQIALAVHDPHGACVGAQLFSIGVSRGKYLGGTSAWPLVIGDLPAAQRVFVFESQWDAFAYLDLCGLDPGEALAATRGVPHAARLAGRVPADAEVIVFRQNDPPGADGRIPDEEWFAKLAETQDRPMKSVRVPAHLKDLNDWLNEGAGADDIRAAMASAESVTPAADPNALPDFVWADDFTAEPLPDPPELIAGILHQGSKLILGGASKSFKTWSLLDMAISVATGAEWLGFPTTQARVLYINLEIQPRFMQKRVLSVRDAKGLAAVPGLAIQNLRGHCADIARLAPRIIEQASAAGFALIIIDPYYKIAGTRVENATEGVADVLNELEKIAVRTGAAVVFGAHFSKGNQASKESMDRISGSGAFARDPDAILTFTAHAEEGAFTVEPTLRNFPPCAPFVLRWTWPLMHRDDALDPAKLRKPKTGPGSIYSVAAIVEALGTAEMRTGELQDKVIEETNMSTSTFHVFLKKAEAQKLIHKSKITKKWAALR